VPQVQAASKEALPEIALVIDQWPEARDGGNDLYRSRIERTYRSTRFSVNALIISSKRYPQQIPINHGWWTKAIASPVEVK